MPSDDNDWWDELKGQLLAAQDIARPKPLLPKRSYEVSGSCGFTRQEVAHVARFVVDVCRGDPVEAMAYVGRFEKAAEDRVFARAVHFAVEAQLQLTKK